MFVSTASPVICSWKKIRKDFKIWIVKDPKILGRGETWAIAQEEIIDLILEQLGDGEPSLNYDKPLPKSTRPAGLTDDEVFIICGGHWSYLDKGEDANLLYTGGYCPKCKLAIGERTGRRSTFRELTKGDYIGIAQGTPFLFSARMINLLPDECVKNLQFREVNVKNKTLITSSCDLFLYNITIIIKGSRQTKIILNTM